MDATVSKLARLHRTPTQPSADFAAEEMWRMAAGEKCPECWDELPEDQKEWWRRCARRAQAEWASLPEWCRRSVRHPARRWMARLREPL
jgi:hypothetical protein